MTLPFALPDWLPWWVPIVLLVPLLLYALAFLFMPFSVIGVKSRLELIEARLDEIYAPEPTLQPRRTPPVMTRPPIPPAPHELEDDQPRPARRDAERRAPGGRSEPRVDWPR